jgi:hypothetical protein
MWHEKSHCHINKSALPSQLKSDFADVTMTISVKKSIEGSKINFSILQEGINNFFFKDKTKHVNIVEGKNLLTTKTHYFCKKKKRY